MVAARISARRGAPAPRRDHPNRSQTGPSRGLGRTVVPDSASHAFSAHAVAAHAVAAHAFAAHAFAAHAFAAHAFAAPPVPASPPRGRRPPAGVGEGAGDRLRHHRGDQRLPPAQRHDPVAAAGDLSDAEGRLRAELRADRPDHPRLPAHRLAAAARRRALHRPSAAALLRCAIGMGVTLVGLVLLAFAADLCDAPRSPPRWSASARRSSTPNPRASPAWRRAGGRASRSRSSRSAAMSARRSGPLLAAFIVLPLRPASVAGSRSLALLAIVILCERRQLVCEAIAAAPSPRAHAPRHRRAACRAARVVMSLADPDRADVLEVRLHGEPVELLHLLPDRPLRPVGAGGAAPPLRLPVRRRRRHGHRRPGRRPLRPQIRDLGLDPRRAAVHARAALRQPRLDGRARRRHRLHPRLGLLGDHRLCAGAGARPRRPRLRPVLRLRLRRRRPRARRSWASSPTTRASSSSTRSAPCLPAIGLLTVFLPNVERRRKA